MTLEAEDVCIAPKLPCQDGARLVQIDEKLWPALVRYAICERVNLETAVNAFIRDGLESA